MRKKVLAMVLSMAMVFTMLPVTSVRADGNAPSEETLVSAGDGCVENLARSATATAGYTNTGSPLTNINNGQLAKGAGESWNSCAWALNEEQLAGVTYPMPVTLTWESAQTISSMRVMWWGDSMATDSLYSVPFPSAATIRYEDESGEWKDIDKPVGVEHGGTYGENGVWNVVNFDNPIKAKSLQMLVSRGNNTHQAGFGISEWEVFSGKLKESIREVNISGEQLLAIGKTATYTGTVLPQTLADKATYTWSVPEGSKTLIQIDGAANEKTVSIEALAEGEATLHLAAALDGGEPKEADFKITTKSEDEKDKEILRASIPEEATADFALPPQTASGKAITWESGNPLITVENNNTAKVGTASVDTDVILTAKVNGAVFDTFTVKVKALIDLATVTVPGYPYTTEYNGLQQWPNGVGEVTVNGVTLREYENYTCSGTFSADPIKAGDKTVILTAKEGDKLCTGNVTLTYTITPKALTDQNVTLENTEYNFTEGNTIKPGVAVKVELLRYNQETNSTETYEYTLVENQDYTVAYSNNTKPGSGTVTIEGKGNYKGTIEKTFSIIEAGKTNIKDAVVTLDNDEYLETGAAITPNVESVVLGEKTLVKDTDYTVSYSNNINPGTATVTITGKGEEYTGGAQKTFTILKDLAKAEIVLSDNGVYNYTGEAIAPYIQVVKYNGADLRYDIDWKAVMPTEDVINPGTYNIGITADGTTGKTCGGSKTITFKVVKALEDTDVTGIDASYMETGAQIKPDVTVKVTVKEDGQDVQKTLVKDTDYSVEYGENSAVGAETGTVTIKGMGHYTGTITKKFDIEENPELKNKINLSEVTATFPENGEYEYTGAAIKPTVTVKNGNDALSEGSDFVAEYPQDLVGVGDKTVTITPGSNGKYKGAKTAAYKVKKRNLTSDNTEITLTMPEDIEAGTAVKPEVSVKVTVSNYAHDWYEEGETTISHDLVKDTDYTVAYGANNTTGTDAGSVTIIGQGNYTGSVEKKFDIGGSGSEDKINLSGVTATFPDNGEYEYTGEEIQPAVTVKNGETPLVHGSDFAAEYQQDLVSVGDKTVTITPGSNGKYEGSKLVTYKIKARNLTNDNTEISLTMPENIEAGTAVKPEVSVKVTVNNYAHDWYEEGEATISHNLVKDTDYTVEYGANNTTGTDAGSVTIIGKGNYAGRIEKKFNIGGSGSEGTKTALNDAVVTIPDCTYNKMAQTPEVTVKIGDKVLVKDTDYTVSYENNINAGTAKAVITAKEGSDYTGSIEKTFTINKANAVISAKDITKTIGEKDFSFGASVDSGVVLTYQSANTRVIKVVKDKAQIVGTGTAKITITASAAPNYNSASKIITIKVNKPKTATLSKLQNQKSGQLKVTWKKDAKATGYKLMYSTDKKFKNKKATKTITIKKNKTVSKTIKKLKKGKKYYVKVCSYVKVGKKEVLGKYSKVKSIKIKK